MSVLVHNESDDDVVCFPTLSGLADLADVEFEPSLGFIEARSIARFDVRVRHVDGGSANGSESVEAAWLLYAGGRLQDRRLCSVAMEPPR
ncbi:MAG: hypothetical protein KGM44_01995, partial [bacterium]|nr:hypothetical protein [bacterium]